MKEPVHRADVDHARTVERQAAEKLEHAVQRVVGRHLGTEAARRYEAATEVDRMKPLLLLDQRLESRHEFSYRK